VYGSSGMDVAYLFCMNIETGEVLWRKRGFAKANLVLASGLAIVLDEDGTLGLVTLSPEGLHVRSQCKVAERYAFAAPTLIGSTLYVRDRTHIMALDLR
jgi:hypothetical protein